MMDCVKFRTVEPGWIKTQLAIGFSLFKLLQRSIDEFA